MFAGRVEGLERECWDKWACLLCLADPLGLLRDSAGKHTLWFTFEPGTLQQGHWRLCPSKSKSTWLCLPGLLWVQGSPQEKKWSERSHQKNISVNCVLIMHYIKENLPVSNVQPSGQIQCDYWWCIAHDSGFITTSQLCYLLQPKISTKVHLALGSTVKPY